MFPEVQLAAITREDVSRVDEWLNDTEVNSSWYGVDQHGIPLHIGYAPQEMRQASEDEWQQVFQDDDRKILSVYTKEGDHIGEGQLVIEWTRLEAQLFLLVGRKDLWHHHYGTAALIRLLDQAFDTFQLHRVWVDVPEYNEHALQMFRQLGFVLEGHLRGTHRKNDEWYDSMAMGLLSDEYSRRRAWVLGNPAA